VIIEDNDEDAKLAILAGEVNVCGDSPGFVFLGKLTKLRNGIGWAVAFFGPNETCQECTDKKCQEEG
jgi:hypothetical protein